MLPVVTPTEMGAIDAAAPEPVEVLIGRAGRALAGEALRLLGGSYGRRVVVVAGKGNNGADGRAAAAVLERRGVRCAVVDAADAPVVLPAADLVIDAAYGTGFRGEYRAPRPAGERTPVLAADVPSGVDGLTGEASGAPLAATATVTFAALKPGLLLGDGAELAGRVEIADIGLDTSGATAHVVEASDVADWLPERPRNTHKWRAACWVVAGSPGMTGAAHLATRAAQRAGAGYVRLSSPGVADDQGRPTEAVGFAVAGDHWSASVLEGAERFASLVVGPGLGTDESTRGEIRAVLGATGLPLVVDGDGLTALGERAAEVLRGRPEAVPPAVLTPHDGEFARLGGHAPGADRFAEVRDLAAATGAVVLLKGSTTLVADPAGRLLVCTTGDARLASAGTGDVLSGIIGALLATGVQPFEAAAAGAWLHGRAGKLAWRRGLVAGDLVDRLPLVFAEL
jgi:NAD(P)H-hydrate epimerase